MLAPEHAEILHRGGSSKADVKRRLWELSKLRAGAHGGEGLGRAQAARSADSARSRATRCCRSRRKPEDIGIIVAGGPGTHSRLHPELRQHALGDARNPLIRRGKLDVCQWPAPHRR